MGTAKKSPTSSKHVDLQVELQINSFIAKFEPVLAARIREVRKALRKILPAAVELVYDNYNFFVIGFCASERTSDAILSLAADKNGVGLNFYYGAELHDPHKLLQGSGVQNRFIRLVEGAKTLKDYRVMTLIAAAVSNSEKPLPAAKGYTVVRSVSAKQRPRR